MPLITYLSIILELNKEFPDIWFVELLIIYNVILTTLGGECNSYMLFQLKQNKMAARSRFAKLSDKEILEMNMDVILKRTQNSAKYLEKKEHF